MHADAESQALLGTRAAAASARMGSSAEEHPGDDKQPVWKSKQPRFGNYAQMRKRWCGRRMMIASGVVSVLIIIVAIILLSVLRSTYGSWSFITGSAAADDDDQGTSNSTSTNTTRRLESFPAALDFW